MSEQKIKNLMRSHIAVAGSQKAAAREIKVSPQYFSDVLNGRREISAAIARAYCFERVVTFKPMRIKP